jgi:hypothetical protein
VKSPLVASEQFSKHTKSLLERRLGIFAEPNDSGSACFQVEANFMGLFGKGPGLQKLCYDLLVVYAGHPSIVPTLAAAVVNTKYR